MNAHHAIRVHRHGGPEALRWERVDVPDLRDGEVRLRQTAIGLNFIDVYTRTGLYPVPSLPFVPGFEGVGVVEAVASPELGLAVGERVGYPLDLGAYAQTRTIAARSLVKLPDDLSDEVAASVLLKGMTARYLLKRTTRIGPGDRVLIHAAAGGVGSLLCPWAKALGATVIGTAGSPEKAQRALDHGCDHAIDYRETDFVAAVRDLTGGEGVAVVYDSVGAATFEGSLECLHRFGTMVTFGNASGPVPPIAPLTLTPKGLTLVRPSLKTYLDEPGFLDESAGDLFAAIADGSIPVDPPATLPLAEAAEAHRRLEGRATVGATVLIP